MKNKLLILLMLMSITSVGLFAQLPESFKYQAVARNTEGYPLVNADISVRISLLAGSALGAAVYTEAHLVSTNNFGLFDLEIGNGFTSDNFSSIDWSASTYYVKVEIDLEAGTNYEFVGTSQLLSVPYALYAKTAGNVNTSDTSATNEIQALSISNDTIYLSNGGFVKLPSSSGFSGSYNDLTDKPTIPSQVSDLTNDEGFITNADDADADATNEIQDLALNGNILTITKNGTATDIDLTPYLDNTDEQELELTGNSLSISGGNSVDLSGLASGGADLDADTTNEIQDLNLVGDVLTITKNGAATEIDLSKYLDDTDTDTDEQTLDLTGNTLFISNGNNVDLSGYLDNTDAQMLGLSGNQLAISGGNSIDVAEFYKDSSEVNEIQSLDLSGNTLSISGGNNVDLSGYLDDTDTDDQTLSLLSNSLSISEGNSVDLSSYLDNTDDQTLSIADDSLAISGGNKISVADFYKDTSALNELQLISISNDTIYLSDGNYAVLPYTAGTGLSLTGTEFANTAPDQTVALTAEGDVSVSGTYPNFTISSTDEDSVLFDTRIDNLETEQDTDSTYFDDKISDIETKQVSDSSHFQSEIDNIEENEIQKLKVSATGDTLYLTGANWVIISGISALNPNSTWEAGDSWQDTRDSQGYGTVQIGNQVWLSENMNYRTDSSYYYNNDSATNYSYGRLYQWAYADDACPSGWHLPTDAEWDTLELAVGVPSDSLSYAGNDYRGSVAGAGTALKESGSSGFEAELHGYRDNNGFYGENNIIGGFWTATDAGGSTAYRRWVRSTETGIQRKTNNQYYGYYVRCVKDE